ncbi:hypothetical protein BH11VER1_BH11VER1_36280 [soil metagenome]
MLKTLSCLTIAAILSSCSSAPLVWKDDGKSQEDLRALRQRNRPSIELARGVVLYADTFQFADKRHRRGDASGHVFLDVTEEARDIWLMRYGYSGSASFDCKNRTVTLSGSPMIEWRMMTQIATADTTTVQIRWNYLDTEFEVKGPTRSDFSKSHPAAGNVIKGTPTGSPVDLKSFTSSQNKRNP